MSLAITKKRRPELLLQTTLDKKDQAFLNSLETCEDPWNSLLAIGPLPRFQEREG